MLHESTLHQTIILTNIKLNIFVSSFQQVFRSEHKVLALEMFLLPRKGHQQKRCSFKNMQPINQSITQAQLTQKHPQVQQKRQGQKRRERDVGRGVINKVMKLKLSLSLSFTDVLSPKCMSTRRGQTLHKQTLQ